MNTRQLIKLLIFLCLMSSVSYGIVWGVGAVAVVFEEILSAFFVVAPLVSAMSIAMFTYLDSIAKDLTELRNEVDRSKYVLVHEKLSGLKREVFHNGVLVAFLFILERSIKGTAIYLIRELPSEDANFVSAVSLSFRIGLFALSLWAATIQIKGFLTTIELRDVIAKNRK